MTTAVSDGLVKIVIECLSECIQVPQPESPPIRAHSTSTPCHTLQFFIFPPVSRMLKKFASFVLSSSKSSTYPRGYASGFDSLATLLDSLFEHPPHACLLSPGCRPTKFWYYDLSVSTGC